MFRELRRLYPKYACKEYLENWPLLEEQCGYREDNLPQLQDISVFLKSKWRARVKTINKMNLQRLLSHTKLRTKLNLSKLQF